MDSNQRSSDDIANGFRDALLASLNLIPTVGGFLSYLGALFIPSAGQSTEQMWLKIIDARISEALFNKVKRDLVGLTDAAKLYRNAVAAGDMEEIRETSISVNVLFTGFVPGFQLAREEVSLLPLFVIAATMHLSLLRDIAIKGRELGLNDASIENYRNTLTTNIQKYTEHVDRYVAQAIDKARRDNPNTGTPLTRNQPLSAMLWTKSTLQMSVIDVRDTWYAFDAVIFPGPTKVRLGREVFTPVAGWWDFQSAAPDRIPDWPAPTSHLKKIEFFVREQWRTRFFSAFKLFYADGSQLETGEIWGDLSTLDLGNGYATKVDGRFSAGVYQLKLYLSSGAVRAYGREPESTDSSFTHQYSDHRLSSLRSIGKGRDSGSAKNAVSGCIMGFQLINPEAKPISARTFEKIAPNIAPQLLDWIAP